MLHNPDMDIFIIFGAKYLYLVIVITALVYVFRQPKELRWKIVICAAVALPLTYIAAKIASYFYYDPRPFVIGQFTPLLPHAPDNGFPSDHTLFGSAIAAVISYFHRRLGLMLFGVAFAVGASRVFAGIHHFIDIFGSIAIAFVMTYLVFTYVSPKLHRYIAQKFF